MKNTNTGDNNSGNRNSGNCNSGNCNSGNCNSGNCNSGNWNSGYCNSGDCNSGCLNTNEPETIRIFNKETTVKREDIVFPSYFYFETNEWIYESNMTDEEKKENPTYKTTGGYLKVVGYKAAWRQSWDKASDEDRKKTLELPNWDNELFKEISGIDVEAELNTSHCHCNCKKDGCNFCPNCGYKLSK